MAPYSFSLIDSQLDYRFHFGIDNQNNETPEEYVAGMNNLFKRMLVKYAVEINTDGYHELASAMCDCYWTLMESTQSENCDMDAIRRELTELTMAFLGLSCLIHGDVFALKDVELDVATFTSIEPLDVDDIEQRIIH